MIALSPQQRAALRLVTADAMHGARSWDPGYLAVLGEVEVIIGATLHARHEIGARIRIARTLHGWTQRELGRRLSPPCSVTTIVHIEKGMWRISIDRLTRIADTLQLSVLELLGYDGPDI